MSFSLTPSAISEIISGHEGLEAIVQVINIKEVGSDKQKRIRTVLSDGKYYTQGMLATQLHHLVERDGLETNAIIRVHKFLINEMKGKKVIILLEADILKHSLPNRIGAPVSIDSGDGPPAAAPAAIPARPMYSASSSASVAAPVVSHPYGGSSRSSMADNSAVTSAPIVHRGASALANGTPITLISQLNLYQNRWTLKARVTTKSDVRTWSNQRGEGSLFSVELIDSSKMDIRATFFKEGVDKYYNLIQEGKVYVISGGKLKVANAQYNTCKSGLEITLDQNSEIHQAEDDGGIGGQTYEIVKIADIENAEAGKNIDVMGVVLSIGEVQSLTSKKNGQELKKCDVTLIDDSGIQIRLTLWGKQAETAEYTIGLNKVLAVRRARVSDYNGKSLSGGNSLAVEPDFPEAHSLHNWWVTQGSANAASAKSLSGSSGGGRMDSFAERKTVSSIKSENLGVNTEKGDYFSFKAHISFLKKDREGGAWYTACPNKESPCNNRCKVTQTTDGNWQCDRCHGTFPDCTRRWIFSGTVADDTASTWVSFFDEQATAMFGGATADEVFADAERLYDGLFAKATHTEWVFKCRAKTEVYNDESRVKTQVVRMDPVDYAAESRDMLQALAGLTTAA